LLAKDAAEPLREQLGLEKNAISDVPYKAYKVGTKMSSTCGKGVVARIPADWILATRIFVTQK
jgi:hypothetical protein